MLSLMSAKFLFPQKVRQLSQALENSFPDVFENLPPDFIERLLRSDIPIFSLTLVTMIWTASKWARSLSSGLSGIYKCEVKDCLIVKYIKSIAFTLGFILMISLSFGFMLFRGFFTSGSFALFRAPVLSVFLTVSIFLIYKFMAARNERFLNLIPGAVFSATAWTVYSSLFSLYVNHYSNYSLLYGSIGLVLVAMLFLYNCVLILFLGALLNVYIKQKPLVI